MTIFPRGLAEIIAVHDALFGGFVMEAGPDALDAQPEQEQPETFDAEYVAKLRREAADYRTKAKANADAAAELAKLKDAQKSAEEKAAEREAAAEKRAVEAEAKALRREIALDSGLSKEDAALLDGVADESAIRALAERLAKDGQKKLNVVPTQGTGTPGKPLESGRERAKKYLETNKL